MVEDVLVSTLLVPGVRPPVCEELPGRRDHGRNQDEEVDGDAHAHERRRKAAERVAHDHDSGTIADRSHDGVGVRLPTGRLLLAREIHGDSVVPALAQRRRNQVPVPRAPTTSMDERERRHRGDATGHSAPYASACWDPRAGTAIGSSPRPVRKPSRQLR